jgi:hypothetical protein
VEIIDPVRNGPWTLGVTPPKLAGSLDGTSNLQTRESVGFAHKMSSDKDSSSSDGLPLPGVASTSTASHSDRDIPGSGPFWFFTWFCLNISVTVMYGGEIRPICFFASDLEILTLKP